MEVYMHIYTFKLYNLLVQPLGKGHDSYLSTLERASTKHVACFYTIWVKNLYGILKIMPYSKGTRIHQVMLCLYPWTLFIIV